ncbi:hypothetical protein [Terrabacter sp. Root85]|uniref:hypothetical protein n=1 Tax=Terrabacter sp. Root85 TaxID=1736603 RepID=UPI0012F9BD75|nr:hypothetical protein [Terrabacter sp. Root85]
MLSSFAEATRGDPRTDSLTRSALRQVEAGEKVHVPADNDFAVFVKLDTGEALTLKAVASTLLTDWMATLPEDRALWTEQDRVSAQCLEMDMAEMVVHATGVQAEPKTKRGWFRRRT